MKRKELKTLIKCIVEHIVNSLKETDQDYDPDELAGYDDIANVVANSPELLRAMGRSGLTEEDLNLNSYRFFQFILSHLNDIKRIGNFYMIQNPKDLEVDWYYAYKESKKDNLKESLPKVTTSKMKQVVFSLKTGPKANQTFSGYFDPETDIFYANNMSTGTLVPMGTSQSVNVQGKLKEITATGAVSGYNIPAAFSRRGGSKKAVDHSAGYTLTNVGKSEMNRPADRLK